MSMDQEATKLLQIIIPILFTLPPLFLTIFLIKRLIFTPTATKNLPPSPSKLPIIGNFHQLGSLPHRSFHSLSKRYGSMMLIHLGKVPTLVVSSADAAREIMKTKDKDLCSRPKSILSTRLLYDMKTVGVSPYGEYWRQMKSIMVIHLLSNKMVQSFRRLREEEIAIMMEKIRMSPKPKPVDMGDLLVTLTNNVVCRVAFGRKYTDGESGKKYKDLFKEFIVVLGSFVFGDFIPMLAWMDWLTGVNAKLNRIAKDIDRFLDGVVEDGMKKRTPNEAFEHVDEDGDEFVDILLNIQKENAAGVRLDRDNIKALLLDTYSAGTDTTATALEWTMAELLRHPSAMKTLQDEVRAVLNGKQHITQDDLEKMKYLQAVLKETLRLHPPLPMLVPRIVNADTDIMGYDIAKGTMVIINAWAIGRDPNVWDKHDEFRPERFLNSSFDFKGHDFEMIPFGAGRRGCPGTAFAMATMESVIANLVHKFEWELPNGEKGENLDMSEAPGAAVRKKVPLVLVAIPIENK